MSKVAKAAVGLMLVTIFSKVLGLVREQFLAATYGTGLYAAAYSTANNIPVIPTGNWKAIYDANIWSCCAVCNSAGF